ncbi:hypothetical protein KNO15_21475 [Leifsonia shinshuensis]|uniref:hypothetical protein n=1 Tax=Leifsonia shinshuensis TaxID=150026 RepID=UPI001F504C39|nr:hypothetical protein [Leifsonia shinshuensis]MCI0159279.1 hypothetical protein [Leifsonia shinshuensis]
MPRQRSALPAGLRDSSFTTAEATALGVGSKRLRGGDLVTPIRGTRLTREADGLIARCRAYALHRRVDFAFSHATAASLYGVPLPRTDDRIHVSVRAPGRAPDIRGHVGHKLSRWETRTVHGLPVTTPEQTWLDLAQLFPRDALVVAGDFFVGGDAPLTDRIALARAIAASPGRRGIGRAREAIHSIRHGAESPGESRLRLLLADAGLPVPLLNHELRDASGGFVARIDLAYEHARVALEYEGDIHRVDRRVWQKDIRRRERVEDLGWRMVRVTADDLHTPAVLVHRVRKLIEGHANAPTRGF